MAKTCVITSIRIITLINQS